MGNIAGWSVSLNRGRCQGWICVFYWGVIYDWWIWGMEEIKRNPMPAWISSNWRAPRGCWGSQVQGPHLVGWITICSIHVFTTNALCGDLGFNAHIFGSETNDWGAVPSSLLIAAPGRNLNFLTCLWQSTSTLSGFYLFFLHSICYVAVCRHESGRFRSFIPFLTYFSLFTFLGFPFTSIFEDD